ncbi:hypothetical protein ACFQ51_12430 [Streptomyces kaempferi]
MPSYEVPSYMVPSYDGSVCEPSARAGRCCGRPVPCCWAFSPSPAVRATAIPPVPPPRPPPPPPPSPRRRAAPWPPRPPGLQLPRLRHRRGGRRFDEFRSGLNAKGEVKAGDRMRTDSDGRSTVEVTATNPTSTSRTYVVQVDFRDKGGNLLDTVVVKVDDVPADGSKDATARSTRSLSGAVSSDVARAVRT